MLEAEEVRLVTPSLTTRLQSWTSDIGGARSAADERMSAIVGSIVGTGQGAAVGVVGDESPPQAVDDALAAFSADALILAVHAPDIQNWRERGLADRVRTKFGIPVTEMILDREGRVVSVTSDLEND